MNEEDHSELLLFLEMDLQDGTGYCQTVGRALSKAPNCIRYFNIAFQDGGRMYILYSHLWLENPNWNSIILDYYHQWFQLFHLKSRIVLMVLLVIIENFSDIHQFWRSISMVFHQRTFMSSEKIEYWQNRFNFDELKILFKMLKFSSLTSNSQNFEIFLKRMRYEQDCETILNKVNIMANKKRII